MYLGDNLLNTGLKPFVDGFWSDKPAAQILLARVPDPQQSYPHGHSALSRRVLVRPARLLIV